LQPLEIIFFFIRAGKLDSIVILTPVRDGEHCFQNVAAELVADSLLEHLARETVAHAIFHHIMKDSGDDRLFVSSVAGENDGNVRRVS
jgi:hypothetical protein